MRHILFQWITECLALLLPFGRKLSTVPSHLLSTLQQGEAQPDAGLDPGAAPTHLAHTTPTSSVSTFRSKEKRSLMLGWILVLAVRLEQGCVLEPEALQVGWASVSLPFMFCFWAFRDEQQGVSGAGVRAGARGAAGGLGNCSSFGCLTPRGNRGWGCSRQQGTATFHHRLCFAGAE